MSRIIGILGGMGPLATADLYRKIILATPAQRDQDHLHVIIDADPTIPDRATALRGEGPDPVPGLLAGAHRLRTAGADFIVIPCNTAHAFLPRLRPRVPIPIVDMIAETATRVRVTYPQATRIGILATRGTVESNLYHDALRAQGLASCCPSAADQARLVDTAIAAVKRGNLGAEVGGWLVEAAQGLVRAGAAVILAACTEIPLVLNATMLPVPLLDPTQVLAEAAVREARLAALAALG